MCPDPFQLMTSEALTNIPLHAHTGDKSKSHDWKNKYHVHSHLFPDELSHCSTKHIDRRGKRDFSA